MPSAIRKRSYGSVTVYSVERAVIQVALQSLVGDLAARPEVLAVVLFGSLCEERMGVGSDVDLLVILSDSGRGFLDRIPVYRPDCFPVDMDIFPYTVEEIRGGQPLARQALAHGKVLWQRVPLEGLLCSEGSLELEGT